MLLFRQASLLHGVRDIGCCSATGKLFDLLACTQVCCVLADIAGQIYRFSLM